MIRNGEERTTIMRKTMKNLFPYLGTLTLGFALTLCTSLQAHAQPVITSVSGTASHGSTVTITGSGFGTKNPVKPLIWADFESGKVEANSTFSRVSLIPAAIDGVSTVNPELHSQYSSRGRPNAGGVKQAVSLRVEAENPYDSGYPYYYVFVRRKYAHANWWVHDGYNVNNYKFYWMWKTPDRDRNFVINCFGGPYPNPCVTRYQFSGGNPQGLQRTEYGCYGGEQNCDILAPTVQVWNREEYAFHDSDPNTDNGTVKFWLNGTVKMDHNGDYQTKDEVEENMGVIFIDNFWTGNPPPDGAYVYMDDLYVDSTWQRVMIGDQNTFSASTRREIQLPKTWSDSSITIQVNAGSFSSLGGSYLYVVDANGQVNQQGYSLCSGCPNPPQNLSVK